MPDRIRIRETGRTWVVRAGGAVIAETKHALELNESGHVPVIYFPRTDVAMTFLRPSETTTTCPHKGKASHFTIVTRNNPIADAAWSYEAPNPGLEAIAGHLAFYIDKVTIEAI